MGRFLAGPDVVGIISGRRRGVPAGLRKSGAAGRGELCVRGGGDETAPASGEDASDGDRPVCARRRTLQIQQRRAQLAIPFAGAARSEALRRG